MQRQKTSRNQTDKDKETEKGKERKKGYTWRNRCDWRNSDIHMANHEWNLSKKKPHDKRNQVNSYGH